MTHLPIALERVPDRYDHAAVVLRIGAVRDWCEPYFEYRYHGVEPSRDVVDEVDELALLVGQWLDQLDRLHGGGTVYLPYDLQDEFTCWLRVHSPDGTQVRVDAGMSKVEGHRIPPSWPADLADPGDFRPTPRFGMDGTLSALVAALRHNRDALLATFPGPTCPERDAVRAADPAPTDSPDDSGRRSDGPQRPGEC